MVSGVRSPAASPSSTVGGQRADAKRGIARLSSRSTAKFITTENFGAKWRRVVVSSGLVPTFEVLCSCTPKGRGDAANTYAGILRFRVVGRAKKMRSSWRARSILGSSHFITRPAMVRYALRRKSKALLAGADRHHARAMGRRLLPVSSVPAPYTGYTAAFGRCPAGHFMWIDEQVRPPLSRFV